MNTNRVDCYHEIIATFKDKYSFLGEEFANELLLSAASFNIQEYSQPEFRVRRHLLLYWGHGWIKSSLLKRAAELLGDSLCTIMSDVTLAALRGTVEHGQFITPYTVKRPFSICTEFGQIVGGFGNVDIVQKLLNVLEEGIVQVSLAKIATLRECDREYISKTYNIHFMDENTFSYKTNWILLAGTYNKRFLVDNAFESRFVIMTPSKPLDSQLVKHVNRSAPLVWSEETIACFRDELKIQKSIDCMVRLPDEVYDYPITIRDSAQLLSSVLCKRWWGIDTDKDAIIDAAKQVAAKHKAVWSSGEDKVFDALESGHDTMEDIMEYSGLQMRQVYNCLKKLGARKIYRDGESIWEMV